MIPSKNEILEVKAERVGLVVNKMMKVSAQKGLALPSMDDELATEVAHNTTASAEADEEGTGRKNIVPKFLVPRLSDSSSNVAFPDTDRPADSETLVNEFKEDDLGDEPFFGSGGTASPRGAATHNDGSGSPNGDRPPSDLVGPVMLRSALAVVILGAIFLCAVYTLVLLILANVYGKQYAANVESDGFSIMFSGAEWATAASDWHDAEDTTYFSSVAEPGSLRYRRGLQRAVASLAAATHGAVESAASVYQKRGGNTASTHPVDGSFWSSLVAEEVLIPSLAGAFSVPSLLTSIVVSLPSSGGSTVFIGLHTTCDLAKTSVAATACIALSFSPNNSASAISVYGSNGSYSSVLSMTQRSDLALLMSELSTFVPSQGPTLRLANTSVVLLTDLPLGGAVASTFSLSSLGNVVVQPGGGCPLCTPSQSSLLQALQPLSLDQSFVSVFELSSPSTVASSFGTLARNWQALAPSDVMALQAASAANRSWGFGNGPLASVAGRVLVSCASLNISLRSTTATKNPQGLQLLVAQRVSGALAARNRRMDQLLSSTNSLRSNVAFACVGLGIAYLVLCVALSSVVLQTLSQLSEHVAAVIDNLHCARTMELERATLFLADDPAMRPSPKNSVSISEDAWSASGPPKVKSLPLSDIDEVRKLQESMNAMMASLRDYRKFLPSTLFLHGEVPLQEELAEELLLGGVDPAASRPASFRVHSPTSFSRGSPRGSPTKQSSFKADTLAAASRMSKQLTPQSSSLKLPSSANPSPRGSRVTAPGEEANSFLAGPDELPDSGGPLATSNPSSRPSIAIAHDGGNLAFCLKRRRATILTTSFVGFLRASQEDVGEAHRASQTFLQIVLSVVDRNGGIVLSLLPDKVVATWNAFRTDANHEANGAMCAYELNRTLQAADEEFLFSDHQVAICVASGPVVAGNTGTVSERASVVHGECVSLSSELLTLLVAINVRCAVTKPVADRLPSPLWCLPIDIITDEDEVAHEIFELRGGEEPSHVALLRKGFGAFAKQDYTAAKELLSEAVKSSIPRVEPNAMRLLKLSIMFAKLQTPYVRTVPAWQRFETDGGNTADGQFGDASPKRKYKSEKRKSQLADEQLRLELMNLRNGGGSTSGQMASSLRTAQDAQQGSSPRQAAVAGSPAAANSGLPSPARRRASKLTPLDESLHPPSSARRVSAANRSPSIATLDMVPQQFRPTVVEFRDKKDMVFRMSTHVLGRGAVGEVVMGMSESGGLVAIKSVPLPSFLKKQPGEEQGTAQLSEIQKRRLKRKGVNVNANIEEDLDAMLNEVAMLSRLRHENIVGYLSSAIIDGKLLVVMEYISGGSLHSLIAEFKSVPATTAKRYLRDTLKGLQYLHGEDIVHRDIKPQNVLILIDGSCKLTDFGTSQRLSKLSSTSTTEGTPQYMSPEASKGRAEKASDVWSFGILMAQLLTGELPWPDDGCFIPMRFLYRLGNDENMVPVLTNAALNAEAQEIIRWCCSRDPAKRPTVKELLAHPYFTAANMATPMGGVRGPKRRSDRSRASVPRGSQDLNLSSTMGGARTPIKASREGSQAATVTTLFKYAAFEDASSPVVVASPKSDHQPPPQDEEFFAFGDGQTMEQDDEIPGLVVEAPEDE